MTEYFGNTVEENIRLIKRILDGINDVGGNQ
jgi:hypothetical protein